MHIRTIGNYEVLFCSSPDAVDEYGEPAEIKYSLLRYMRSWLWQMIKSGCNTLVYGTWEDKDKTEKMSGVDRRNTGKTVKQRNVLLPKDKTHVNGITKMTLSGVMYKVQQRGTNIVEDENNIKQSIQDLYEYFAQNDFEEGQFFEKVVILAKKVKKCVFVHKMAFFPTILLKFREEHLYSPKYCKQKRLFIGKFIFAESAQFFENFAI